MTEHPKQPEPDCKKALAILGDYMLEIYNRSLEKDLTRPPRPADESGKPMSEDRYENLYREACAYLGEGAMPEKLLDEALDYIEKKQFGLKKFFWPDFTLLVALLPVSDIGKKLKPREIKEHRYMHPLMLAPSGETHNLSLNAARFAEIVPEPLRRKCSMQMQYADKNEVTFPAPEEVGAIMNFYVDAFNAIREFLGMEPIDKEGLFRKRRERYEKKKAERK